MTLQWPPSPGGGFVVVWRDDMGAADDRVYFQRYDALGQAVGGATLVPFDGAGPQDLPSVASYRDGGFIIGVRDYDSASDSDSMGYRYNASGVLQETIAVDQSIQYSGAPIFSDGYVPLVHDRYYAAMSYGSQGNGDIFLSLRTAGTASGNNLVVNTLSAVDQRDPTVAFSPVMRDAAVAWISDGGSNESIKLRIYRQDGGYFTTDTEINIVDAYSDISDLQVSWVGIGLIAIAFNVTTLGPDYGEVAIYNMGFGTVTRFYLTASIQNSTPQVTALEDGRVAVFYTANVPSISGIEQDIRLQIFNVDGTRSGREIILSTDFTGVSDFPSVATLADGRIVVTWTDTDASGTGIMSQIIDPRDGMIMGSNDPARAETLVGHAILSDEIKGFRGNDTVYGLGADDALYGGDGTDTLHGGKGDDVLYGGRGNDLLIGGQGDDDLFGEAGNDTFRAGAGADLFNGGGGEDVVEYFSASAGVRVALDGSLVGTGDAAGDSFSGIERIRGSNFADTLRGDASANVLFGEGGGDVLQGLAGNDILRGNAGADTLTGGANVDTFQYFAVTEGGDSITDFSAADDRFQFLGSAFGGLPAGALAASRFQFGTDPNALAAGGNVRFYYETDTRTLWYDADGLNGGAIAIATLQTGASMTVADIFIA